MYEGVIMSVQTICGETVEFSRDIGFWYNECPYLLALIIAELTDHIQEEVLSCILFADY